MSLIGIGLTKRFGQLTAVDEVDVKFLPGSLTAVVGANGAGKTSLLDCLSGHLQMDTGTVLMNDDDLTRLMPWERGNRGMLRGFQDNVLFPELSVADSLLVAGFRLARPRFFATLLRTRTARLRTTQIRDSVDKSLTIFGLESYRHNLVTELSLGMSKILQLAIAYVANPQWLLLDEPSAGLARAEIDKLAGVLRQILRDSGAMGIVMVEHDASLVANAADRLLQMDSGKIITDSQRDDPHWVKLLGTSAGTNRGLSSDNRKEEMATVVSPPSGSMQDEGAAGSLAATSITIRYGKFTAVERATVTVQPGEISCLVGSNGAGKSSVLNVIAGIQTHVAGSVYLNGTSIDQLRPHERVEAGIALIPAGRGLLAPLTVGENLALARRKGRRVLTSGHASLDPNELFPELLERRSQPAGTLSGGEQQMLAIARSLYLSPRYLLIDELSLGLNPKVVARLIDAIAALRDGGLGILVVEQDGPRALEFSDQAFIIHRGRMSFVGPAHEARKRSDLFHPVFLGDRVAG